MRKIEKLFTEFKNMVKELDEKVENKKCFDRDELLKEIEISLECSDNPVVASSVFWHGINIEHIPTNELVEYCLRLHDIESINSKSYVEPSETYANYNEFCNAFEKHIEGIKKNYKNYLNDINYQNIKIAYSIVAYCEKLIKGYDIDKRYKQTWKNK